MYAIYGVPWIPSIYPKNVSIFLPAPAGPVMGYCKGDIASTIDAAIP